MRITNNYIYRQSSEGLERSNERYLDTNRKIIEQSSIVKASDDPVGAGQVLRYEANNRLLDQYKSNGTSAKNGLEYQHVALTSLNDLLDKARSLVIQSENGANSQSDLDSIAQELSSIRDTAADLMNSKNSDGDYLFSGTDTKSPPFQLQSNGRYEYFGNEGKKFAQLAETVSIPVSESGKSLFQDVPTRRTFTSVVSSGVATMSNFKVGDQGAYDLFVKNNYDAINPALNQYLLTTTAGSPDSFTLRDAVGTAIASGDYTSGEPISVFGMEVTMDGVAGSVIDISLDPPVRDNVLNEMQKAIDALKDPSLNDNARQSALRDASVSMISTQSTMGAGLSNIGSGLNTITQIESYQATNKLSNQSASSNISGLDIGAASAELAQAEAAISASQLLFTRLTSLSLFNVL
ncbi:flagellar hook-associated protein FlgL [Marinomonas algicola]|uniref:flagellar hook-associated protein FlgL n=1 Tax=Marinomonas algicola TaxID=2773454 RepID=UPI00174D892E|nr:flagellar hook-associated protein FlgL [Marinomonas algicola]